MLRSISDEAAIMASDATQDCYFVLFFQPPAGLHHPIGILLYEVEQDRLSCRLLDDYSGIADDDDAEVLSLLGAEIRRLARTMAPARLVSYLEETLSNNLQLSDRIPIEIEDRHTTLDMLFERHVLSSQRPGPME